MERVVKNIYLLSGLGADQRAFQRLQLPGYNLIFVEWVAVSGKETLAGYAQKLLPQIPDPAPIIIGLSFGGMLALELAKYRKPAAVVLVSSARSRSDLPAAFPLLVKCGLLKIIPAVLWRKRSFILEYLMGLRSEKDKQVLAEIIADTDIQFLKWALTAMSEWENDFSPERFMEVHGTADRLIPFRETAFMHAIEGGGHLMVLDRAPAVRQVILSYLSSL